MTLSCWASGHALPAHVRSCSSTDIMNPGLALSNNGAIELSITPFSQLFSPSTSYLHYSLFWLSLFFVSSLTHHLFYSCLKKSFGVLPVFPTNPTLPSSNQCMNSFLCQVDPHLWDSCPLLLLFAIQSSIITTCPTAQNICQLLAKWKKWRGNKGQENVANISPQNEWKHSAPFPRHMYFF